MSKEHSDFKWTRGLLLDLIEFTRHSSSSYGITNIYEQFIEIVTNPDKSLQQWYLQQAKDSLTTCRYKISDMEAAFNLSRDRVFNRNGVFGGFRFHDFECYMRYREQGIAMELSRPDNDQEIKKNETE